MGLITKTVKTKWSSTNKERYESLGYKFTKYFDELEVKIEDLSKTSGVKVYGFCDCCGKDLSWTYQTYNSYLKKDGKIYCCNCSKKINSCNTRNENLLKNNKSKSIAQYILESFPDKDLYDVWDKEKNGDLNPWKVCFNSHKKCWFKCTEKDYHYYEMNCNDFSNNHRCPYCVNRNGKVHPKDSLGQYIIDEYGEEFLYIWSDKNNKSPFEYSPNSHYEVWWKCPDGKHEDFERKCQTSTNHEFRCPKCVEEMKNSIIEEKTKTYLEELSYKVLTEHECTIRPINPKTKMPLPFDNEIILENGKHLIIEVHGEQHYKIDRLRNKTKEDLHYQQVKDRYKRIKCKQAGYEYLEIPYTAFKGKNKEQYKQIIDNKINEILNISKTS